MPASLAGHLFKSIAGDAGKGQVTDRMQLFASVAIIASLLCSYTSAAMGTASAASFPFPDIHDMGNQ
jgi:hypothetical protein